MDITRLRETRTKDDGDWDEWPYPTVEIESVISGELRARILAKLGHTDDGCEVRLIETNVSGGWSEFTQEDECSIEVKIGSGVAWRDETFSTESAMERFLKQFA